MLFLAVTSVLFFEGVKTSECGNAGSVNCIRSLGPITYNVPLLLLIPC
jgi:hypothetical protein